MCATQWTIYMSLVTQETDPGDGLRRVIMPPPSPPSCSSINDTGVIYFPARAGHCFWPLHPNNFQGKLLLYCGAIHQSGKMLNKIQDGTLKVRVTSSECCYRMFIVTCD